MTPHALPLREALRLAREVGLKVTYRTGTGEWFIVGPDGHTIRHNARRHDASRALVLAIRRAERRQS
jgi:hypothetical protein